MPFQNTRKAAFYRWLSDGELVGSIAYFCGQNSAPDGWVLCDGSAISRTTYATLFSAVGTTYGAGDGSTTFALPNLIDKFVEGSTTVGTVKSAGLPNIIGSFAFYMTPSAAIKPYNVSGAFESAGSWGAYSTGSSGNAQENVARVDFFASRSNPIYGNSTTVQPPALTMKPFIYTGKTSVNKWLRTA